MIYFSCVLRRHRVLILLRMVPPPSKNIHFTQWSSLINLNLIFILFTMYDLQNDIFVLHPAQTPVLVLLRMVPPPSIHIHFTQWSSLINLNFVDLYFIYNVWSSEWFICLASCADTGLDASAHGATTTSLHTLIKFVVDKFELCWSLRYLVLNTPLSTPLAKRHYPLNTYLVNMVLL